MKIKTSDIYSTSDLCTAAFLAMYYPIWAINKVNPSKVEFVFKKEDSLSELIEAYWRREIKIEPQSFFAQIKYIKTRLHNEI